MLRFTAACVCVGGKDEFVHSEQMSLNLELLQPVADTLGSSPWSGGGGGGDAEGCRRLEGRRASGVTRCVCVSSKGWGVGGGLFPSFFFFLLVEGEYQVFTPPPLTTRLLHSQIQPDRVLPAGLLGAGKAEPRCGVTVAAPPRSGCRFSSQGHGAQSAGTGHRTRASCGHLR